MKVVYERPTIYLTTGEVEAIYQTMKTIKELAYKDEDIKLFNDEDGFDYKDLYTMFETLKRIVEKRAKILDENED